MVDGEMLITDVLRNPEQYGNLVNLMSTRYLKFSGQPGHDQFFEAFDKFNGGTRADQIAELTNRAARQNISYTEIMLSIGKDISKEYSKKIGFTWKPEAAPQYQQTALLEHAGRRQGVASHLKSHGWSIDTA